jgi:hypothetical protein
MCSGEVSESASICALACPRGRERSVERCTTGHGLTYCSVLTGGEWS